LHERTGECHALSLATRKLINPSIGKLFGANAFQSSRRSLARDSDSDATEFKWECNIT
jgi:hypothetical protein